MSEKAYDPYLIPGTRVLRNKLRITSANDLRKAEADFFASRLGKLLRMKLRAEGTVEQLQWMHGYLFQDVYDWAGQIRTIDMSKGKGSVFQPLQLFSTGILYAEQTLRSDNLLRGFSKNKFAEHLSTNFDNFNTLHPFREGNGRTQRVFWSLIARDAGWSLNWNQVTKEENNLASFIAHENVDYSLLTKMFNKISEPYEEKKKNGEIIPIFFKNEDTLNHEPQNVYRQLTDQDYKALKKSKRYEVQLPEASPKKNKDNFMNDI